jgi:hypothetical protein
MPDLVTGTVEIAVELVDETGVDAQALADLASTWLRAVEIGLFGPGRIRGQADVKADGRRVSGGFECEDLSQTAFHALARMIRYFSKTKGKVKKFDVYHEGQRVVAAGKTVVPALPQSIPFELEYPEDLKRYLRVELEFRRALSPGERDAIFAALTVWDALIEALAEEEWWEQQGDSESESEYESRLLSPAMVEHWVDGYFASIECLDFIVWLGLRLHERLTIDRITME